MINSPEKPAPVEEGPEEGLLKKPTKKFQKRSRSQIQPDSICTSGGWETMRRLSEEVVRMYIVK